MGSHAESVVGCAWSSERAARESSLAVEHNQLDSLRRELEDERDQLKSCEAEARQKAEEAETACSAARQRLEQLEGEMKEREQLLQTKLSKLEVNVRYGV